MSYTSRIPILSETYVIASSRYSDLYRPYFACDPATSLVGNSEDNAWASQSYVTTNQAFHIQLQANYIIKRIYYENFFDIDDGSYALGARNFGFYAWNAGQWEQLAISQNYMDYHVNADQADPKYITVTNTLEVNLYGFWFIDNWGSPHAVGVRRIELQTEDAAVVPVAPTVTTGSCYSVGPTVGIGNGNAVDDGGATVTVKGVCWNTGGSPTTSDSKTEDGTGEGSFSSSITGLFSNVTYYVRAYATNSVGTSYGSEVSFRVGCRMFTFNG